MMTWRAWRRERPARRADGSLPALQTSWEARRDDGLPPARPAAGAGPPVTRLSVAAVLRQIWLIALVTALAAVTALLFTNASTPLYEARGTYVIGPSEDLTEPETIVRSFDSLQGQGIVPTLVELLSSRATERRVGERIGLTSGQLEGYDVRANVLSSSNTLELTVRGPDARLTRLLAAGIGRQASSTFEGLYSVYQIVPLDEPEQPEQPVSPSLVRNLLLSIVLGVTAGTALAVWRLRPNDREVVEDGTRLQQAGSDDASDRSDTSSLQRPGPPLEPAGGRLGTSGQQ